MFTDVVRRVALVLAVAVAIGFAATLATLVGVVMAPPDPYYVLR